MQLIPRYNHPMANSAAEILEAARRLPPSEINWLIGELLQEGDGSREAEIEASWKSEVERRVADADRGNGSTCSWEEVQAPLRARLGE
jgi:putative addiction module component (TIGR02574 family)